MTKEQTVRAGRGTYSNRIGKNMFYGSVPLVFLIFTLINRNYASWYNIRNTLYNICPILLLACGLTFVILLGSIDLSTGALCACTCVLTGTFLPRFGNIFIFYMLLFGLAAGLLTGALVSILKIPSFIATLCTQSLWLCIALVVSSGTSSTMSVAERKTIAWTKINILGLPILFWISVAIIMLLIFIQNRTSIGKSILAIGSNATASRMSGVPILLIQMVGFAICSICSATTGVWYALIMKGSVPSIGDNLGLLGIASVALGGTSMAGGSGSVVRTIFGCTTIVMIRTGLNLIGTDAFWQDIVFGFIIVLALYFTSDKSVRNSVIK